MNALSFFEDCLLWIASQVGPGDDICVGRKDILSYTLKDVQSGRPASLLCLPLVDQRFTRLLPFTESDKRNLLFLHAFKLTLAFGK